jgi:hypothetical protein
VSLRWIVLVRPGTIRLRGAIHVAPGLVIRIVVNGAAVVDTSIILFTIFVLVLVVALVVIVVLLVIRAVILVIVILIIRVGTGVEVIQFNVWQHNGSGMI